MVWDSASDFFAMGGYGLYVWGAYGVTVAWMCWSRSWPHAATGLPCRPWEIWMNKVKHDENAT